MKLREMIVAVFIKLIQSYKAFIIEPSKDWFVLFRILLMAVSIFVYAFTTVVVLAVLLIVVCISLPISIFQKK